jgi:hypothetical protein
MKTALRLFLLIALLLAALATVALVGALQWLSTQDMVRLIIDGQPVHLRVGQDVSWLAVTAAIALAMLLVFLIVPLILLLALGFSAAAGVLSLAAALSPLLLMGALAWWIFRRNASPTPPTAPTPSAPQGYAPGPAPAGSGFAPGSITPATKD